MPLEQGLLIVILAAVIAYLVKRPYKIVYVENPQFTSEEAVDIDTAFHDLVSQVEQRSGRTTNYRSIYLLMLMAAPDKLHPVPTRNWTSGGVIFFQFEDVLTRNEMSMFSERMQYGDEDAPVSSL